MSAKTDLGEQLYQLLPSVYRERDNTLRSADNKIIDKGDLAKYLDANGDLLNQIYYSIKQQLNDNFADSAGEDSEGIEQSCQPWLLPYFARLLDVNLVSPDIEGQRAEISNAIAWRQSKGTMLCLEGISEAIGQFEIEIQEGWKRVATTARIGDPLLPALLFGANPALDEAVAPAEKARHPGLPYVTIDFRYASRAVQCEANSAAGKHSRIGTSELPWCQLNHAGVPCFNDSYQDVSKRTVDFRTSRTGMLQGRYHPAKLLCYTPLQVGFFSQDSQSIQWSTIKDRDKYLDSLVSIEKSSTQWGGRELPLYRYRGLTDLPLKIIGAIHFEQEAVYEFENIWLMHSVELAEGLLSLHHCAASKLVLRAALVDVAVLTAKSCLINKIDAAGSLIELDYCTVLTALQAKVVRISDCILTAQMHSSHIDLKAPEQGCIRYSRYAEQTFDVVIGVENSLLFNARSCTTLAPIFLSETFGEPGCAVLAEQSTERIKYGAQDGGEMGAFHDDRLILKQDAVIDKLQGFLPVGISAVLVSDSSMRCAAPKNR